MTSVTEQYSEEMPQSYGIKLISVNSKIHFQICKCEIIDARMNHIKGDVEMLLANFFPPRIISELRKNHNRGFLSISTEYLYLMPSRNYIASTYRAKYIDNDGRNTQLNLRLS